MRAVNHRNRRAPIALAGNQPVAHAVVYLQRAVLRFGQFIHNGPFRLFVFHAVKRTGIDQHARAGIRQRGLFVFGFDYFYNRQIVFGGKYIVAFIMRRHRHHAARAVGIQHIIRNPNRHLAAVDRVDGISAGKYPCFFTHGGQTINIRGFVGLFAIGFHGLFMFRRGNFIHHRMLRRDYTIGIAKQRVRPGGKHGKRTAAHDIKRDLRTFRAADPVCLHRFDAFRPIQVFQPFQQFIGIVRNFKEPLR